MEHYTILLFARGGEAVSGLLQKGLSLSSRPAEPSVCKGGPGIFLAGRPQSGQGSCAHTNRTLSDQARELQCLQVKEHSSSSHAVSRSFCRNFTQPGMQCIPYCWNAKNITPPCRKKWFLGSKPQSVIFFSFLSHHRLRKFIAPDLPVKLPPLGKCTYAQTKELIWKWLKKKKTIRVGHWGGEVISLSFV